MFDTRITTIPITCLHNWSYETGVIMNTWLRALIRYMDVVKNMIYIIFKYIYTYIYIYTRNINIYIYVCVIVCVCIYSIYIYLSYIYIFIFLCITHTYVYLYIYIYITHIYMYILIGIYYGICFTTQSGEGLSLQSMSSPLAGYHWGCQLTRLGWSTWHVCLWVYVCSYYFYMLERSFSLFHICVWWKLISTVTIMAT